MILGGISQFFNASMYVYALFSLDTARSCSPSSRQPECTPVYKAQEANDEENGNTTNKSGTSQSIVIGVYVIIFGACVGLLEFQIPPQVSRYASFMFSFIGRGICTCIPRSVISHLRLVILRYILLPSRSVLTRRSLHLYRLHSALQPLDALRSRLHHRADRHCIHCSGVCALD